MIPFFICVQNTFITFAKKNLKKYLFDKNLTFSASKERTYNRNTQRTGRKEDIA